MRYHLRTHDQRRDDSSKRLNSRSESVGRGAAHGRCLLLKYLMSCWYKPSGACSKKIHDRGHPQLDEHHKHQRQQLPSLFLEQETRPSHPPIANALPDASPHSINAACFPHFILIFSRIEPDTSSLQGTHTKLIAYDLTVSGDCVTELSSDSGCDALALRSNV